MIRCSCMKTGKTFAELSAKEKNEVSHRANAAAQMRQIIRELFWP